jgi:hypothetical protein
MSVPYVGQQPLLGPKQRFPQRCGVCNELFSASGKVSMVPILREGEGDALRPDKSGRVLWALWICGGCSGEEEPLRRQREEAERFLGRSAIHSAVARR